VEITPGTLTVLALIALAVSAGVLFKLLSGRGREISGSEVIDLTKLKALKAGVSVKSFGKKATLLQFSTEYCSICPSVSRLLSQLEYRNGGLLHLEVDITERLDLAAHFQVSQTPTVFILDPQGQIKFRVSGAPKPGVIQQELEKLGAL
jgi:thiol-disulfide isomerase/thioredoxin